MTRRIWCMLAGLALATAMLEPGLAGAQAPSSPAPLQLEWGPCPDPPRPTPGLECALLEVPRDYSRPDGPTIEVAVSRLQTATPQRRHGVLLFNPGGPGGSGLYMPIAFATLLPPSVLERYDLIGFDPRGIARSSPVTCGLPPELLDVTKFIPWPAPNGDIDGNIAYARAVAESCGNAASADLLPHITTANTARDMDRIRAALGEPKISYLGYSYGSYLGAVYASLFPERSDRIVLDSVVHPGRIWRDTFRAWGPAVEIRFPDFTRWAAQRNDVYGLGSTSLAVRRLYFELAAELDAEPLRLPDGTVITGDLFRSVNRAALYSDADFPDLAQIWQIVNERDATRYGALGQTVAQFPPIPPDAGFAGTWAVLCDDAQWPEDPDRYRRDVRIDRVLFPVSNGMPANVWPCSFWPNEPREAPVAITGRAPASILLVQGLRDPATPYDGAIGMRIALGNRSRLVSVDVGGHAIAYGINRNVSRCADAATTDFLVTGQLPRDTFCPREAPATLSAERQRAVDDLRKRLPLL
jgi:pimeloyl-ACP methyl ester carboxylesterase